MRLAISVLGRCVLEVSTEPEPAPPPGPRLEATSGGQFEFGFNREPPGQITCREVR